jgi:type IV pilus assembly protein PilW
MKRTGSMAWRRWQHGLGLTEVLVAMAIGVLMLGAVGYLLIGSKKMNSTQDDVARMQESGRIAMEILGKALRQAGFQLDVDQAMVAHALAGTDYGGAGAAAQPDTLTVQHDPAWIADTGADANTAKGQEVDCEGNLVVSDNILDPTTGIRPVNTQLVKYAFSVDAGRLLCKADDSNPAVGGITVADNIENMQIQYGIGNGSETITSYTATPTAVDWQHVTAVRVSLLARGPTPNQAPGNQQKYTYNGVEETSTDGYLRQVYTSTFTVRNQARWK